MVEYVELFHSFIVGQRASVQAACRRPEQNLFEIKIFSDIIKPILCLTVLVVRFVQCV